MALLGVRSGHRGQRRRLLAARRHTAHQEAQPGIQGAASATAVAITYYISPVSCQLALTVLSMITTLIILSKLLISIIALRVIYKNKIKQRIGN